jgi:uncharacterized Zn-finger protein
MTDEVIPHFHNDPGVQVIEIGAKKFMCMGRCHLKIIRMSSATWARMTNMFCPYCSTLYRHNPALALNQARPAECEFHDVII